MESAWLSEPLKLSVTRPGLLEVRESENVEGIYAGIDAESPALLPAERIAILG